MVINDTYVTMQWNARNKTHYVSKGYQFTHMGDEFPVQVKDLTDGSKEKVPIICDVCGKQFTARYGHAHKQSVHACSPKCAAILRKQTLLARYGVDCVLKVPEFKEKSRRTLREHYGVDNPSHSPEILKKIKQTTMDNHGVDCAFRNGPLREQAKQTMVKRYGSAGVLGSPVLAEKVKQTILNRYGTDHPMRSEKIKAKQRATTRAHYGVDNPSQVKEIRAKVIETMNANGTGPCSRAQRHLAEVLGGELNYPLGQLQLDCALVDQKIDVEYDGSGHALSVRYGKFTQAQFDNAERRRDHVVVDAGWKLIRLKSSTDKLPADDVLRQLIAWVITDWLPNHHWVTVDLDAGVVANSNGQQAASFNTMYVQSTQHVV